ncbi:gamma-glutamyltransferase [candidate division KSB1 bacterium]|nr:gamma-glutamyltransferase [candidate division KSB1 bacterium]
MTELPDFIFFDRTKVRDQPEKWQDFSNSGLVVSAHYRATQAGIDILSEGGNAFDAAIAVSTALGIVEPAGSGLGGNSILTFYSTKDGSAQVLINPCRAPAMARPELVGGSQRKFGYQAAAVPTNAATLAYLHTKYGSMLLDGILAPVIEIAHRGFFVTPFLHRLFGKYRSGLLEGNAGLLFLQNQKIPPTGSRLSNKRLGHTLQRIADEGFEEFYTGTTAFAMLRDMHDNGGFISQQDFDPLPSPQLAAPLWLRFFDWDIAVPPPPAGGLVLAEMLNLFRSCGRTLSDPDSPEAAVLFARIIRRARQDRRRYRHMPLDISRFTGPDLLSYEYAKQATDEIFGKGETSHFNIIDKYGNVVAMTQSIERSFGCKMATPDLGFIYNGFMQGFKIHDKAHPHYLRPGAVARSNAAPTLVLKDGRPIIAIGSTGSERMASGIFQVLIRLYLGQTPFEAVKAPRLHCTPESEIFIEAERFSPESIFLLRENGFILKPYPSAWAFSSGGLHLIARTDSGYCGVADPRRDGAASGL